MSSEQHKIEIQSEVMDIARSELDRATKKFGPTNNSSHESASVIREEKEEAEEALKDFAYMYEQYWDAVKRDDVEKQKQYLVDMTEYSKAAAAEMIQACAMCIKALNSFE